MKAIFVSCIPFAVEKNPVPKVVRRAFRCSTDDRKLPDLRRVEIPPHNNVRIIIVLFVFENEGTFHIPILLPSQEMHV